MALEKGKPAVIKRLIENDDCNADEALLRVCFYEEDPEILRTILKFGPNVRARDEDGRTAVHHACLNKKAKYL